MPLIDDTVTVRAARQHRPLQAEWFGIPIARLEAKALNKPIGERTMFTLRLLVLVVGATLGTHAGIATAQESPPPAMSPPIAAMMPTGPSDLELRAVGERPVSLRMTDGSELPCQILAMDPATLVVRLSISAQVVSVPRASIMQLLLRDAGRTMGTVSPADDRELPQQPTRSRHVGISLSISPGVSLDLDYGLFRAFANIGVVLPLATEGEIVPFSVGAGLGIPLSKRRPSLKLDVFGYLAAMTDTKAVRPYIGSGSVTSSTIADLGFGVGIGLHHTWNNGLTLGGTVPILGYSIRVGNSSQQSISTRTAYFYLASVTSLPLFFIGYRF